MLMYQERKMLVPLILHNTSQVMLDGFDVHALNHSWLHRAVGLVGQEPVLFRYVFVFLFVQFVRASFCAMNKKTWWGRKRRHANGLC